METPQTYARHLATYIASPTKIECLTRVAFGRAPPLHEITNMRLRVEQRARRPLVSSLCRDSEAFDGEHFMPAPVLPSEKPVKLVPVEQPPAPHPFKVIAAKGPKWRAPYVPVADRPCIAVPASIRAIIEETAETFGVTPNCIQSRTRRTVAMLARAVTVRLIRDRTWANGEPKHSTTTIGKFLNRDHSTICHALNRFDDYCRAYPEVAKAYQDLSERFAERAA